MPTPPGRPAGFFFFNQLVGNAQNHGCALDRGGSGLGARSMICADGTYTRLPAPLN